MKRLRNRIKYDPKTPFDSVKIIFNSLTKVGAGILNLSVFALIIGWIQANSYFSKFGVDWILNETTTFFLISYSWIPIVALVAFLYLGIIDIIQSKNDKGKEYQIIWNYGFWIVFILPIVTIILGYLNLNKWQMFSLLMQILFTFLYAGFALQYLILEIQNPNFKLNLKHSALIFAIIFYGIYLGPMHLGDYNAKRDIDPKVSNLPYVKLKNNSSIDYRLLYSNNDKYYLINLADTAKYPYVHFYNIADIECILKNK